MRWINMELPTVKSRPALSGLALAMVMTGNEVVLANTFNIDVSNDDIAVEATNASLKELLQELEKLTGIPVKFVAETNERVTLNVGMTSVENAISKITPNHMIVHENQNGKEIIKELIIIPANSDLATGSSGSDFLPNGNPTPAIAQPPIQQPQVQQPQVQQPQVQQPQLEQPTTQPDPNQPPTGEPALPQPPSPEGQVN